MHFKYTCTVKCSSLQKHNIIFEGKNMYLGNKTKSLVMLEVQTSHETMACGISWCSAAYCPIYPSPLDFDHDWQTVTNACWGHGSEVQFAICDLEASTDQCLLI